MSNLLDTLLTRREAFKVGASSSAPIVPPARGADERLRPVESQSARSARFVIFVMLEGGQSHVDSWDLKEGKWTPQNFDIREIAPGVKWPMALFPQLASSANAIRRFVRWRPGTACTSARSTTCSPGT